MSYSIAEIEALLQKAALGAGFPPAQSERFGKGAAVHLARGGAEEVLTDALKDPGDSPILRLPLLMDDLLRVAPTLEGEVALSLHEADGPLAIAYAQTLPVRVSSVSVEHSDGGTPKLNAVVDLDAAALNDLPARLNVEDTFRDTLAALAARTYVPSTEASRLAGAGAGLSDND